MSQFNGFTANKISHEEVIGTDDEIYYEKAMNAIVTMNKLIPSIREQFAAISEEFKKLLTSVDEIGKMNLQNFSMVKRYNEMAEELEKYKKDRHCIEMGFERDANERVYLDVGGRHYTTTVKTLTKSNSIYFETLIHEKWIRENNNMENPIFIDRDGDLFGYILKFLRTNECIIKDQKTLRELINEAKEYKLKELEDLLIPLVKADTLLFVSSPYVNSFSPQLSPIGTTNNVDSSSSPHAGSNGSRVLPGFVLPTAKARTHPSETASTWRSSVSIDNRLNHFHTSCLLKPEYETKLNEFLDNDLGYQNRVWKLIYRATIDGFDASDFHRCCDGLSPTVTIIQSDFGNIFGGFTSIAWSSAAFRVDQEDATAFLFTLKNMLNIPPTKFPIAEEHRKSAVSHNPTCGPNFGSPKNEGSDLCLRNKFNEKGNCVFFPKSYADTTNHGCLIFAKRYFVCKEVEVFTLTDEVK